MLRTSRAMLIAAAAIAITRIVALPRTVWEFDEALFAMGAQLFDPVAHHPPPPGYPVFMLAAQLARVLIPDAFVAIVALNFAASILGFVLLALAFREISGSEEVGIAGSLLFWMSPVMLVHSTTAFSDIGALALLSAALWFAARDGEVNAVAFAIAAACAVGWRPQFSIAIVPLLLIVVLHRRERFRILAVFAVVCLGWLVPLATTVGGFGKLIAYEAGQAGYLAEHDADASRGGWSVLAIALRFIAQPWGAFLMSLPLLGASAAGIVATLRARERRTLPLAIGGAVYLVVALLVMDPADGARYSLPATLAVAYFAARGLTRFRVPFVTLFTLASLAFVSALLSQRATSASPPVQAAAFAQRTFPSNAIALYELPLWPHATYLLAAHHPMRVDNGLRAYFDRPDVPLYIYADGATSSPSARTFRWQPSDAYSTLTRNHYRVVSVIPLPPEQRFLPLRGVYAPERAPEGEGWRWLAPLAELQLPSRDRRGVDITLGLPATTPFASNDLTISIDGQPVRTVRIARGATLLVSLPLSRGGATIRIDAARSFVAPPDPRTLAVRLLRVVAR